MYEKWCAELGAKSQCAKSNVAKESNLAEMHTIYDALKEIRYA